MAGSRTALLVCLALGLEGVPPLASAQHCDASADVVVQGESVVPVYHGEISGAKKMSATLFLQPLAGFQGISVEASMAEDTFADWLPTDQCCSGTPHDSTWVPVKVEVEVKWHTFSVPPGYYLHSMLDFGGCVKKCKKYWGPHLDVVGTLKVAAHGSFTWKCGSPPDSCRTSCSNTTTTTTTTTCEEPPYQFPGNSLLSSPCNATTPTPGATNTPATTTTPTATTTPAAWTTPAIWITQAAWRTTPTATPTPAATPASPVWSSVKIPDDKYYTFSPSTLLVTVAQVLLALNIVVIVVVLAALILEMRRRAYKC